MIVKVLESNKKKIQKYLDKNEFLEFKGTRNTYRFSVYDKDNTFICSLECFNVNHWYEAEKQIRQYFPSCSFMNTCVRGSALNETPNACICLFGTEEKIQEKITQTILESNRSFATSLMICDEYMLVHNNDNDDDDDDFTCCESEEQDRVDIAMNYLYKNHHENKSIYVIYEHHKDKLNLPGGKRFLGESPLDCAVRELKEETGIEISLNPDNIFLYVKHMKMNIYFYEL